MQWEVDFLLFLQNNVRNDFLDVVMKAFSSIENYGIFSILICVILLSIKKTRHIGVVTVIALLISVIINQFIIKSAFARTRPYVAIEDLILIVRKPKDYSFPSGHSANSFVVAGTVLWCLSKDKKWIGIILMVICGFIAFSRLYVGAHYPTDVICGTASGLIISIIVYYFYLRWAAKQGGLSG